MLQNFFQYSLSFWISETLHGIKILSSKPVYLQSLRPRTQLFDFQLLLKHHCWRQPRFNTILQINKLLECAISFMLLEIIFFKH